MLRKVDCDKEFRENRRSENPYFTYRPNWISVSTSHIYYPIWLKFRNKRSENNAVEHFWAWSKSAQERP
jgi:hypothetical protein